MALFVDIEKTMGDFRLQVSFTAEDEIFSLLGASGCGKSMTLKCIAGIERPDRGQIVLDGKTLFDSERGINLPPQQRRVGYLFQQYALFPNMTVRQNIRCGIRRAERQSQTGQHPASVSQLSKDQRLFSGRQLPAAGNNAAYGDTSASALRPQQEHPLLTAPWLDHTLEDEARIDAILQAMQLEDVRDLRPAQLSGGQQQRAALARILINAPDIVMLDEPFSALDAHLRFHLEREVHAVMRQFGRTVLLISHDRDEVFRMADRIAIMENGKLQAVGAGQEVFADPVTVSGARLTGCKNIARAQTVTENELYVPSWGLRFHTGRNLCGITHVGIRMHDIHPLQQDLPSENIAPSFAGRMLQTDELILNFAPAQNSLPAVNLQTPAAENADPETNTGRNSAREAHLSQNAAHEAHIDTNGEQRLHGTGGTARCRIVETIENPFSMTIMLQTAEGTEPFGMELGKAEWQKICPAPEDGFGKADVGGDSPEIPELDIFIPESAILLLRDR